MADIEEKASKIWQHIGYAIGGLLIAVLSHSWSSHDLAVHSDRTDKAVQTMNDNHSTTSATLLMLQKNFDELTTNYQITVGDLAKEREISKDCQRQATQANADLAELKRMLNIKSINDLNPKKKRGKGSSGFDPLDPGVTPEGSPDDFHIDFP